MDSKELNKLLNEHSNFLSEVDHEIRELAKNFYQFLNDLDTKFNSFYASEDVQNIIKEIRTQTSNIESYIDRVHYEIPEITNTLRNSEATIHDLRGKLKMLGEKVIEKQKRLEVSEAKVENLTNDLERQCQFSSAMGSILATMLWKSSKTLEIVNVFIQTGTLREFLCMTNTVLESFCKNYSEVLPPMDSYEFKYIMSILGTAVNVSAQVPGRDFILEDQVGLIFISTVLRNMNLIPMPNGKILKRMFIMLLFNLAISKKGAMLIQMSENGVKSILMCLKAENPSEIHLVAFKLLLCLLTGLPDKGYCQKVVDLTCREDIHSLLKSENGEVQQLAEEYLFKLREIRGSRYCN